MKIKLTTKQYFIVLLTTYMFVSIIGCSSKVNNKPTADEQDSLSYVETASTDPAPLSQKEATDIMKSLLIRHSPQAETVLIKYALSQNQPTIIAVFNETNSEGLPEFHYAIARNMEKVGNLIKQRQKLVIAIIYTNIILNMMFLKLLKSKNNNTSIFPT